MRDAATGRQEGSRAGLRDGLAMTLVAFSVLTTAFWTDARALFAAEGWAATRARAVFRGVPADEIAAALGAHLAPGEPVALAPVLRENEFLLQRLGEALYPRRVEDGAANVLDVVIETPPRALDPRLGIPLARMEERVFVLRGAAAAPAVSRPAPAREWRWSWPGFAASALAAIGVGLGLAAMLARWTPIAPSLRFPVAIVLGAVALGVAASVGTWLQVRMLGRGLLLPGLAFAAGTTYTVLRRGGGVAAIGRWLRTPEHALFAALAGFVALRTALLPIALWDGRSIWLLQAHRLFEHGRVPADELRSAAALASHPDYPLLLPAWLASFSGFAPAFDERLAAMGLPVLFGAGLALLWQLARDAMGRIPATAVTIALFLGADHATAGGYADGFLACFLAIAFLAFASRRHAAVGWIAAAAASLVKAEGLFLAVPLAGLGAFAFSRDARRSGWRRLLPFGVFVPALAHALWTRASGVDSISKETGLAAAAAALVPRLAETLRALPALWTGPGYTHLRPLLWAACAALGITAALRVRDGRTPAIARVALGLAAVWTAFALLAIAGLPEDVAWFVDTALDRLLLHPAVLLLLVPFLWLAPQRR